MEMVLEAKDQRIAELEAEVRALREVEKAARAALDWLKLVYGMRPDVYGLNAALDAARRKG